MRNENDTENDRQRYHSKTDTENLSELSAYIAKAIRENHHHHDKREHIAQMTVCMIPTCRLSHSHKYGNKQNDRRHRVEDKSNSAG